MVQTTNNNTETTKYILSIQVSLNGLSFCTVNSDNEIIALEQENFGMQLSPEQTLDKIKNAFNTYPQLKYDFSSVEVIYQNDLYTFVPKALFDQELLKEYLKHNIKILENDFIVYDELDQHDLVTVYIPYININNFFFEAFGSFTFKHSSSVLIDTLLSKEKNNEAACVYAHMHAASFDLIVINKGKLVLGNSYIYDSNEDFLYYLMFTVEQLRLNPEEFQLIFLGDISKNSDCYTLAYKYIRHIDFGNKNEAIKISESLLPIEAHQHFVLLSNF
ncbi:DUF3822 family protein [Aquimarina sp. 2201CG14-23]|uniref:DUF3822 family protein n=1 Tax=Aquimarina mycalae TaxID=3040073 RepID=UPI0024780E2F|nr:DUF3822 family protein [Aquimarina sp. 2201CG14-23]MDH7446692.1 DUF3822 family protein [Aquimarina sp. 2201CG14-23]